MALPVVTNVLFVLGVVLHLYMYLRGIPAGLMCILSAAISDLLDVVVAVHNLTDWKLLGLQLGLQYSTLMKIKSDQRDVIDDCKMEMLSAWLQQQDDVSQRGVPSWPTLKIALRKMGENAIAESI